MEEHNVILMLPIAFFQQSKVFKTYKYISFSPSGKKKKVYLIICKNSCKTKANLVPVNRKCSSVWGA